MKVCNLYVFKGFSSRVFCIFVVALKLECLYHMLFSLSKSRSDQAHGKDNSCVGYLRIVGMYEGGCNVKCQACDVGLRCGGSKGPTGCTNQNSSSCMSLEIRCKVEDSTCTSSV